MRFLSTFASASVALALSPAMAEEPHPKLGPDAVPVTTDHAYLRTAPAPDYWAFSPFVKPQFTSSACSIASVTAAVNGLAGLPPLAEDAVMTQPALLEATGIPEWAALSAEGGDGVTFAQLEQFTAAAAKARGLPLKVSSFRPLAEDAATLADLRARLVVNEASADDVALVYFNQGVVTGDWDGPHISLIGAYDAQSDRVLILEVDQEWYIPYWTPLPVLLKAMLKPTSAEHGPLEGETGGLVILAR
ncbi:MULTISPECIES: phytochelatin synthase family protein [Tabrizicola]|uniref:phytochelatin synthase family protein n=1 Tax=Tabrizicola TaxID=1443919 RepID=UPI0010822E48|nr:MULTISPECIES: phytochelatin synthase family protein [Paracoccaceae]